MKHAAVLYTCVGLMGAAALAGFIDYSDASKSGIMASLYQEESQTTGSTLLQKKPVDLDDYSRGPIDERFDPPKEEESALNNDEPKRKKKRSVKLLLPPPPPPVPEAPSAPEMKEGDTPPPPSPLKEEVPPVPVIENMPPAKVSKATPPVIVVEAPPAVEEKAAIGFESFSRAPLKKKRISKITKGKQ